MKLRTLLFVTGGGMVIACGGSQKPEEDSTSSCEADGTMIAEQLAVCDSEKVMQFEVEVRDWQARCQPVVDATLADRVARKVTESMGCSEEARTLEIKKKECQDKVSKLSAMGACAPESCQSFLKEIQDVIAECELVGEEETNLSAVRALVAPIEAQISGDSLIAAIEHLNTACTDAQPLVENGDTAGAIDKIILAIASLSMKDATESKIPEIEAARTETFDLCKKTMETAIRHYTDLTKKELKKRKVKKQPEIWLSKFRHLEGMSRQLREAGAESIYPEATDEIDKLLLAFDRQKKKFEAKEKRKMAAREDKTEKGVEGDEGAGKVEEAGTAKGTETVEGVKGDKGTDKTEDKGIDEAEGDGTQNSKQNSKRCARIMKEIKRVKGKIAEHEKAGNEKKVKAYTLKLKKSEASLEAAGCSL